jgi:tetratricopeptide (TPR) repeat protein
VARALEALAWPTSCLGAYQEAAACWQESLLICQKIGNQWGVAYSEFNLGWVAFFGGIHLSEAFEHYHKALAMFREHGYRLGISQCCGDLALVTGESGDYELAMQYGREGLAKAREIRFNNVIIYNLCGLGAAACGLGDLQTSRNYLTEALLLGWETRILGQLMNALFYFAALLVKESNLAASTEPSDLQKKTRALELLAIVLGHPATWQPIKDRAARLQAEIEAGLARDNTTTATAPGQSRPLEEVVTEMLQLSYTPKMQ